MEEILKDCLIWFCGILIAYQGIQFLRHLNLWIKENDNVYKW